jgi:hypothetical protein
MCQRTAPPHLVNATCADNDLTAIDVDVIYLKTLLGNLRTQGGARYA